MSYFVTLNGGGYLGRDGKAVRDFTSAYGFLTLPDAEQAGHHFAQETGYNAGFMVTDVEVIAPAMIYQVVSPRSLLIEGSYSDCNDALEAAVRNAQGPYWFALRRREIGGSWRILYTRSSQAIEALAK